MNLKKEININKNVIVFILLLNIISLCSYYSYALFQVNILKNNAIVIQTGTSLDITTKVDNTNTDTFTLTSNQVKNVVVNLDTNGITSAMSYKMYYELTGDGTFTVTSTENFPDDKVEGIMQPYDRGNNTKITGKQFTLTFTNNSTNTLTIKLGAIGGFEAEGATLTTQEELLVNTISIIFNPNGGTMSSLKKNLNISSTTYGPLTEPIRDGYNFQGWFTSAEGGTEITASTTFTYGTSPTTLYAHWEEAIQYYTVTFNKNGGSGGTDSVQVAYGQPMPEATAPNENACLIRNKKTGICMQYGVFCGYFLISCMPGSGSCENKYYNYDMSSAKNYDLSTDVTLYAYYSGGSCDDIG